MKARETPLLIAYNEYNGGRGLARETKGKAMFTSDIILDLIELKGKRPGLFNSVMSAASKRDVSAIGSLLISAIRGK